MKNRRLTPRCLVSTRFARLLAALGVPAQIPFVRNELELEHALVCRVPLVCAELFEQWQPAGRSLHKLKIETVAMLAKEAFVQEGGKLKAKLSFDVETREKKPTKGLPTSWFVSIMR